MSAPSPQWRQYVDRSDAMEAWEDTRPGLIDHPLTMAVYGRGKHNAPQRVDPACLDPRHLEAIREYEAAEEAMGGEAFERFRRALRQLCSEMTRFPERKDVRGEPLHPFL